MFSVVLAGCRSGTLPDPNDYDARRPITGDILLRNAGELSQMLDQRVGRGEIDQDKRQAIQERELKKQLKNVDAKKVPAHEAWQFGDVYRMAGEWETARDLFTVAAKVAKTNDRIVNDTLRLARVEAHLGQVSQAIKTARTVFNIDAKDKAPILLAVLYEIVPEGAGKGQDLELAHLLEDAIKQHKATIVNATNESGRAFLRVRPVHIHFAWVKIAQLYQGLKMDKEARQTMLNDEADRQKSGAF